MNPYLAKLPALKMDSILETAQLAKADNHPQKIDVVVGAYRDGNAKPYILPSVLEAERRLLAQLAAGQRNKEYEPTEGFQPFCEAAVKLLYGSDLPPMDTIAKLAALSGTGAVRIAAAVFAATAPAGSTIYCSKETWPNHFPVARQSGFKNCVSYRYFEPKTKGLDYDGMMSDLAGAAPGSVVIVHGAGHNPTGVDLSTAQWDQFASIAKSKQWFVILDSAYQGYASGDLERDGYGARALARAKVFSASCQSFAKNMGLYGDRCGCVAFLAWDKAAATRVLNYAKAAVARPMYSSPPIIGYRIAHIVLTDPVLRPQWELELQAMSARIRRVRKILFDELQRLKTPGKWDHVVSQIGMFSYLGITTADVDALRLRYHIYMLPEGRVSMAGLNDESAVRFARALDDVLRNPQAKKQQPSKL